VSSISAANHVCTNITFACSDDELRNSAASEGANRLEQPLCELELFCYQNVKKKSGQAMMDPKTQTRDDALKAQSQMQTCRT